ncbi:5281_t:CDS:2, partial [Gigaspora rosea]
LGHSKAVKEKFANTQKTCRSHLNQCQNFISKYSESEREKILEIQPKKTNKRSISSSIDDDDNLSIISSSTHVSIESSSSKRQRHIDDIFSELEKPLSDKQKTKFNELLLKAISLANKIEESSDPALYNFPYDILANISNPDWWKLLKQLENLLEPYCSALNKLQTDKARLYEVLHTFGWITRIIKGLTDSDLRNFLLNHLERRWKSWEQLLLLISFILHPEYQDTKFNKQLNGLSLVSLGRWMYMDRKYPFDNNTYLQFQGDVLHYWQFLYDEKKEISRIATRIFSIGITTASVERMFSCMGWLHSSRRSRLEFKKVVAMTQLRTEILQNRKSKEILKVRENFHNTNATTLLPRENSDSLSEVQKENIVSVTGWKALVNR